MEAVQHYFKTIERGNQEITIELPEGVDKAEVEVIIRPLIEQQVVQNRPSRSDIIRQYKGIFKDTGYQVNDYDVYDQ